MHTHIFIYTLNSTIFIHKIKYLCELCPQTCCPHPGDDIPLGEGEVIRKRSTPRRPPRACDPPFHLSSRLAHRPPFILRCLSQKCRLQAHALLFPLPVPSACLFSLRSVPAPHPHRH